MIQENRINNLESRIKHLEFLCARAFKSIQREAESTYEQLSIELKDLYKELEVAREIQKQNDKETLSE